MNKIITIRVRRGTGEAKYYACDNGGNPIMGFNKLSDIRRHWKNGNQEGRVEIIRELGKTPDMKTMNETKRMLETILKSYAKKS